MGWFESETVPIATEAGHWRAAISGAWSIGENSNGGYLLSPALRAMAETVGLPDPISITTHFLRPGRGGLAADIDVELVRRGRTVGTARAVLGQDGAERLVTLASFGDLSASVGLDTEVVPPDPCTLPPPDQCKSRSGLEQGVDLPITSRVEVRIHPDHADGGISEQAVVEGWIRFVDDEAPSTLSLPLFADAFPPAVFPRFGRVGWVPTIELTVHVRRAPAPGWVRARFECDDLIGGRMIETGTLWDSTGAVVARCRQIGLVPGLIENR